MTQIQAQAQVETQAGAQVQARSGRSCQLVTEHDAVAEKNLTLNSWKISIITTLIASLALAGFAPQAAAAKNTSREKMISDYRTMYEPLKDYVPTFTGNIEKCQGGKVDKKAEEVTLAAINYYRSLAGVKPLTLETSKSTDALAGALAVQANGQLLRGLSKNDKCFTPEGRRALRTSVQYLYPGENAISLTGVHTPEALMRGWNSPWDTAGNRRWLLYQQQKTMGVANTTNVSLLNIMPWGMKKVPDPRWAAWPSGGYFPAELEPRGLWSLSYPGADFRKAKVSVSTPSGPVKVKITDKTQKLQGDNSIVWRGELPGYNLDSNPGPDYPATVTVTGIRINGKTVKHSYTVTLVKAGREIPEAPEEDYGDDFEEDDILDYGDDFTED